MSLINAKKILSFAHNQDGWQEKLQLVSTKIMEHLNIFIRKIYEQISSKML